MDVDVMKHKIKGVTHQRIIEFLKTQSGPVSINRIAMELGTTRNAVQVRLDTLTYYNPRITEDERGRVYIIQEASHE
jgi:predicted ArsR family transcriptional regulator